MKIFLYSVHDFSTQTVRQLISNPRVLKLDTVGHIIMKCQHMDPDEYETRLVSTIPNCITEFGFAENSPELIWAKLQLL